MFIYFYFSLTHTIIFDNFFLTTREHEKVNDDDFYVFLRWHV